MHSNTEVLVIQIINLYFSSKAMYLKLSKTMYYGYNQELYSKQTLLYEVSTVTNLSLMFYYLIMRDLKTHLYIYQYHNEVSLPKDQNTI